MGDLSEAGVLREYGPWAAAVFEVADLNKSGDLTINELKSQTVGSEHQGFVEWLFFYRSEMFKMMDVDGSGTLEPPEVAQALRMFHVHVKNEESQPLVGEDSLGLVARKMLEHMYRHANGRNVPSFRGLFRRVDDNGSGTLEFGEVEDMLRKYLRIPPRKLPLAALRAFYQAIDNDGNGYITESEFVHYMMKVTAVVSKGFVSFPPPPEGMASWGEAVPEAGDNALGMGFDWGQSRAPWLIPKTYEQMVALNRTWRVIGNFTSIQKNGVTMPPRFDPYKLPSKPPLPDIHTALRTQIQRDIIMKERRENTAWDLSGARHQITRRPLDKYHVGRNVHHGDLLRVPTRYGGMRVRYHEPICTPHGKPMGTDEQLFADQKGDVHHGEAELFMDVMPPTTGVYDRLCNVTTTSRLFGKMAYADDVARARTANGKRKGSAPRFAPL